ncbi:MAG: hypothetical protein KUG79_06410 [Pseudomonadales bacterium]|nr:hypothetical protein [Pseudomonadales bacterium]
MNVSSAIQHNPIARDASRLPTRKESLTADHQQTVERRLGARRLAENEPRPQRSNPTAEASFELSSEPSPEPTAEQQSRASAAYSADQQQQLARPPIPIQQKAIDFYTITAAIGDTGGEGELIGVDTYA